MDEYLLHEEYYKSVRGQRWRGTTRSLGIPTTYGHRFLPLLRPIYGPG